MIGPPQSNGDQQQIFFQYIKKVCDTIKLEEKLQILPNYYYITPKEFGESLVKFKNNLSLYYKEISELVSIDYNFAQTNNFFLFNNFYDKFPNKLSDNEIRTMIYSPHSIFFLHELLYDLLNPHLTKDTANIDEYGRMNDGASIPISLKIEDVMNYCPKYLKIILSGENARKIFDEYIVKEMFEHPHLFYMIRFNQKTKMTEDELSKLKLQIFTDKMIMEILGFIKDLPNYLEPLPDYIGKLYNSKFLHCLHNFQELINMNYNEAIPSICVTDDHFFQDIKIFFVKKGEKDQEIIFENMLKTAKDQDKIKEGKKTFGFLNAKKEFELRAYLLYQEHYLNYNMKLINGVVFQVGAFYYFHINKRPNNISISEYIKNPRLFFQHLSDRTLSGEDLKRIFHNFHARPVNNNLIETQYNTNPTNPVFSNLFLLDGITYEEFISKRPALKIADEVFVNSCLLKEHNEEEEISSYITQLWELYKEHVDTFQEIITPYVSSFMVNIDPYYTARAITKSYQSLVQKVKSVTGYDLYKHKADEEKFILTLFKLARPPNFFSMYVYLYEFMFAGIYDDIYVSDNKYLENLLVSRNIMQTIISHYNFDASGYCRIDQSVINVISSDVNQIELQFSEIVADESNDIISLIKLDDEINDEKTLLKTYFSVLESFNALTIRFIQKGGIIRIFNLTIDKKCKESEAFPKILTNKEALMNFVNEKLNPQKK